MTELERSLKERVEELETVIEKYLEEKAIIGTIASLPFNGKVRVKVENADAVLGIDPRIKVETVTINAKCLVVKDIVTQLLPKEFEIKPEKIEYDKIKWEDVGGLKSQIATIREKVEKIEYYKDYYRDFNLSYPKGILLYGAPGCGKTLIAKAITTSLGGENFIYLKGGELLSPYVGATETKIKEVFDQARKSYRSSKKKTIIFIDEAEAILPKRGSRFSSDVDTTIVPTFLSEMDGFEQGGTFVILATNFKDKLDPAVIRPGRIDYQIEVTRPTLEDTIDIFNVYFKKYKIIKKPNELAEQSAKLLFDSNCVHDVSGALIAQIVQEASMEAIKRYEKTKKNYTITSGDIKTVLTNRNC